MPFHLQRSLPFASIAAVSLSLSALHAQDPSDELELIPGKSSALSWPGLDAPITVRLPDSWTPERKWPVIFYYHGTGGHTTISLPVAYTGGDHFVIVGMTYTIKGSVAPEQSDQFYSDTVRIFEEVRTHLAKVVAVNPDRAYVGGFSKGGWSAAHFADRHPLKIAGALILGAGVNPFREGEELPRFREDTPVYVGVGQFELNYAVSLQSADHYGKRGARVTLDVYDGLGHQPASDPQSDYLEQWLLIEAHRDDVKQLKPAFDTWLTELGDKVAATEHPVTKYLMLERAGNAPFARFLNKARRQDFSAQLEQLKKQPAVAEEWELRALYESTRRNESDGGFRLANWEKVILDYATIYRRGPATTFGKRAGLDALRVLDSIREAVRQRSESGRDPGDFLSTNARLVSELEQIPRSSLVSYFENLRRTLTIPLLEMDQ
ncbi:MAG: hypothetical protein O3C21_17135 [Verrucomicrobia bacterium]|nr:hypothetical protein [Verrucomicrobiota bacterium]